MKKEWERLTDRKAFPRKKLSRIQESVRDNSLLSDIQGLAGYKTDPDNPNSMAEKDVNAALAIRKAGELLGPLIEWAINHEIGKAIKNRKSIISVAGRELSDAEKTRNLSANSHENEWLGGNYDGLSPRTNRISVGSVFQLLSEGMGFEPGKKVAGAIRSLEYGVVYDELKPRKSGRKQTAIKTDNAILIALRHVEFRNAKGMSYEGARMEVAEAFNLSAVSLKKLKDEHETRLGSVDPMLFKRACEDAWALGALIAAIDDSSKVSMIPSVWRYLDINDPATANTIRHKAEVYSDTHLKQAGCNYQLIKGV